MRVGAGMVTACSRGALPRRRRVSPETGRVIGRTRPAAPGAGAGTLAYMGVSILLLVVALVVIGFFVTVAAIVRSRLGAAEMRGELPDQQESRRPEHLAVGTEEQLEQMGVRRPRRPRWPHRAPSGQH